MLQKYPILSQNLTDACESLRSFSNIASTSDVSSFELQHSGIISSLIVFLTQQDSDGKKDATSLRKVKSTTTPPMATRRRSKMESRKAPLISEIGKSISAEEQQKPKSASSDDTGHFASEAASESIKHPKKDEQLTQTFYPLSAINRDERLRRFLNVFVGLPVSSN